MCMYIHIIPDKQCSKPCVVPLYPLVGWISCSWIVTYMTVRITPYTICIYIYIYVYMWHVYNHQSTGIFNIAHNNCNGQSLINRT